MLVESRVHSPESTSSLASCAGSTGAAPRGPRPAHVDGPRAELERLGDRIAELSARIQAATYELLVLIRQFDERIGWGSFASCAQWLSWRTGLAPGAAREHVRVARALEHLPKLSAAMRRGVVSYSKVRAVTRVARPETEQALLDVALAGTAAHVEQVVRGWRRVDRAAEAAEDRRRHETRSLRTWVDDDGMVVVRGRLTPEVGAVMRRALEAACEQARGQGGPGSDPAAGECRRRRRSPHPCSGPRPAVSKPAAPSQTVLDEGGGIHVSAETARRLACDAATVTMQHGPRGEILDVGRRTRTISAAD